jgi:hypothetical protein
MCFLTRVLLVVSFVFFLNLLPIEPQSANEYLHKKSKILPRRMNKSAMLRLLRTLLRRRQGRQFSKNGGGLHEIRRSAEGGSVSCWELI